MQGAAQQYTAFFVVGVSGPPGTVREQAGGSSGTSAIASIAPGVNSSIAGRCWSMAEATASAAASTPSTDCATCISTYVPCG